MTTKKQMSSVWDGSSRTGNGCTTVSTTGENIEQFPLGSHNNGVPTIGSSSEVVSNVCGYKWQPRKSLELVKERPSCKTREWK